ncbi:conserved hypothetical protein [Vibrio crassostreae]|nr:conserved hypothetical protein [Vibrio crassostreae]CAK1729961.1 conserved hypothetical protein [Vibrio crassostreae]CAK1730701.1 conserved hypothetical protein [Vibrio crassostreae]CAK1771486.1 conserved hypothetical protein [Vibrio crassostreae]CAK1779379.1 conserved hypothetical protein [Vibrio crassostreae]
MPLIRNLTSYIYRLFDLFFVDKYASLPKKKPNRCLFAIYSKKKLTGFAQLRIMRPVHNEAATSRNERQFGNGYLAQLVRAHHS